MTKRPDKKAPEPAKTEGEKAQQEVSKESEILQSLDLDKLPFNIFQESKEFNISAPLINENDMIDDPLAQYKANMIQGMNNSIIDLAKPYYGYTLEESKILNPKSDKEGGGGSILGNLFSSAMATISSLFGGKDGEIQCVWVRIPFIHAKTVTSPDSSPNKNAALRSHTLAFLDTTIFDPSTKIEKNKLVKIIFTDQTLSFAKIIGITGQQAGAMGGGGFSASGLSALSGAGSSADIQQLAANYEGRRLNCASGSPPSGALAALGIKVKKLCPEQQNAANIIIAMCAQTCQQWGIPDKWPILAIPMLTNSIRESSLDPKAVGDHGCSIGLFQLNTCGGVGTTALKSGWATSKEQLKDPYLNAQIFISRTCGNIKSISSAVAAGDIIRACKAIVEDGERPLDKDGEVRERTALMLAYFGR